MNAFSRIGVVFIKEVADNLRDRRSLVSSFISTLITPALLLGLILVLGKTMMSSQTDQPLELPVMGAENAPTLIQFLEQNNVVIKPAPADPQEDVRQGKIDIVLIIPKGYGEDFSAGRPAEVQLVLDSSRTTNVRAINKAQRLLQAYDRQIGSLRLMARGVSPSVTNVLLVEEIDMATPESQVLMFLNMMPFLVLITIFTGGMYVIIDTTAGERERSSLEPLLINPVARWEFVIGKYAAAIPFVLGSLAFTLAAYAFGFNAIPLEDYIGFQMSLDTGALVNIFLVCLPIIFLATAIQMIVATYTRSFKEAQTYTSLISFIPALPGAFLAFLPTQPDLWKMLIPTFGQQLLINQILRGETVSVTNIAVSAGVTLLATIILMVVAVRLFQREQILFGTK